MWGSAHLEGLGLCCKADEDGVFAHDLSHFPREQGDTFMKSHLQIPLILILVSLTSIVSSQQWAPGLPESTPFPNINALDQHGETWTNKTLVGERGLIFFFVRSSD